ncbi:MAG: Clp protease N-terminal domain-containing protein [Acidimicrobiia bacterium]
MPSEGSLRQIGKRAASGSTLDQLEAALAQAQSLANEADDLVGYFVARARGAGHSWTDIGERLGVSKQAARQRFKVSVSEVGRDRFMPRLQRCLVNAAEFARGDGCAQVGTPHLLWALATSEGVAANALARLGLDIGRLEAAVRASMMGTGIAAETAPSEAPEVVEALTAATSFAMERGHDYVGTEHLLFVLAGDRGSIPNRLLGQLKVSFADIKRELEACIAPGGGRKTPSRRRRKIPEPACSFCGRTDCARLVAGPGVFICEDCARLAVEISQSS